MIQKIFDAIIIAAFTGLVIFYISLTPYLPLGW